MPETNMKTTQKNKRRKKTGLNLLSSDFTRKHANTMSSEKNKNKFELNLSNVDAAQDCRGIDSCSLLKTIENDKLLKKNYTCNQDVTSLQEKIVDLINQRDELIRYHRILSGSDMNNIFKNINPNSLESEIADLKSMISKLQKGLNVVLDEHTIIKHLVIDHLNDVTNLLEWNTVNGHPNNSYNVSNVSEKHNMSSKFQESSGFLLKFVNSNKKNFDVFENSSTFKDSHIHSLKKISEINFFGNSEKNDSMAKFRQLAELKIIVEILQKYSRIVTNEFQYLNSDLLNMKDSSDSTPNKSEDFKKNFITIPESVPNTHVLFKNITPNQEPLDFELKTNGTSDQQDYSDRPHFGTILTDTENHFKPSGSLYPVSSNLKSEENDLKINLGMPREELNISPNQFRTAQKFVIKEKSINSNGVLKYNSTEHIENTHSRCVPSDKIKYKSIGVVSSLQQPMSKINKLRKANSLSSTIHNSCAQDTKHVDTSKILLLSDGHGCYCSEFLQDELGSHFSVISVVKPDARFEEIIRDFNHLASAFSRKDYVIIFAGSNNLKCKEKIPSNIEFELVLPIFQHTNVLFTRIPLLFDFPSLNSHIQRVNSVNSRRVFELARKNSNILHMPKFTFFSRDHPKQSVNFNKIGKKKFCKQLAKVIINDFFIKRQKPRLDSQCIETCQVFIPKLSEITTSQSFNDVNELKMSKTATDDECNKIINFMKTNRDNFDGQHQLNKHSNETKQQLKKNIQTQTTDEYLDYPSQLTNKEILNVPLHSIQNTTINFKNKYDNGNLYLQSPSIEQHSNVDGSGDLEDHRQRQGFFAGIFMKNNHTNMTTIKELLGQGDIPKPKKNFIQENVKRLKELKLEKGNKLSSQRSRTTLQPLTERRNAQTMVSSSRFSQRPSVSGRPSSQQSPSPPLRSRRPLGTTKHVTLDTQTPIVEVDESPKGYRNQGCQTLNGKQLEHLYEEGVIRYPSVRELVSVGERDGRIMREMGLQTETPLETLHAPPSPSHTAPPTVDEGGLHWDEEKKAGEKDFVRMNATIPDPRRHKTPDLSSTDPTRAPPTYQRGVVPKYLREQKKELERERISKAKDEECPEGHIQLPDDIKQKHLTTLKQNYADLVSQLNQLPVSTDTLRTRTRKKQIETDLDRIEAAIALFSREKVFVKADS